MNYPSSLSAATNSRVPDVNIMSIAGGGGCSAIFPHPSRPQKRRAHTHTHTHTQTTGPWIQTSARVVQYSGRLGGMFALFRRAIDPDYQTTPAATTVSCS
jgi:hypothetical protein